MVCSGRGIQVRQALYLSFGVAMNGSLLIGLLEESLLVIRGLGIQTSTSSATYLSKASTRFIPTTQIQDIVIHEAFKGFEVRFYLAVIVEGEGQVVVVFPVSTTGDSCVGMIGLSDQRRNRNSYRVGLYWKRCGEARDTAFTIRNPESRLFAK